MRADKKTLSHKLFSYAAVVAMTVNVLTPITAAQAQTATPLNGRTPIKHLIVVVGENRSFDNVFATYVPSDPTQSVWNLLSQGIVDKNGAPGPSAANVAQRRALDNGTFQLAPPLPSAPYPVGLTALPQPNTTLTALPGPP
jgi:phospholipase C